MAAHVSFDGVHKFLLCYSGVIRSSKAPGMFSTILVLMCLYTKHCSSSTLLALTGGKCINSSRRFAYEAGGRFRPLRSLSRANVLADKCSK